MFTLPKSNIELRRRNPGKPSIPRRVVYVTEHLKATYSAITPSYTILTMAPTTPTSFHKFPDLARELQNLIWKFAARKPKVLTLMVPWDESDHFELIQCRSGLETACRASRHFAVQPQARHQLPLKHKIKYFVPAVDTIRIDVFALDGELNSTLQKISKLGIESLGLPCGHGKPTGILFSGSHAKWFTGLKEIVVIMGRTRWCGEQELVAVNDTNFNWNPSLVKWALDYVDFLRADMEKVSKKWKTYQRKRVRQGKSSSDWAVPSVRIAWMIPMDDKFLYAL
jgi:hypothetical protein